jgi:protein-disulfide isomerase
MSEEQLSKKEQRALRHAEKAEKRADEARRAKRESFLQNIFIWGFVAILGAGLVLFVGNVLTRNDSAGVATQFDMPVDVESEWIKGNREAEVTIVEYADFQCPACATAYPVVNDLLEEYGEEIRFVYRHFPLIIHRNAEPSAWAAEAAGQQGKFFEMHDLLYANQDEWSEARSPENVFRGYAEELALDLEAYDGAYLSEETRERVSADLENGREFSITATPTFFVNGKLVRLTNSYAPLIEAVETAIAEVGTAEQDSPVDETEEESEASED